MSANLTLITGGARSGKSELAELLAGQSHSQVHYLATMQADEGDRELLDRIERHRRRRPIDWHTHEVPFSLHRAIAALPPGPAVAIIDCLALYVSNALFQACAEGVDPYLCESTVLADTGSLLEAISARADIEFIAVTNEVGWGIVPDNAPARAFRDFLGATNQLFAEKATTVWLLCSGLKLRLK